MLLKSSITDTDLPPIRRVQGNCWKMQALEYSKELVKSNRGISRLKKKIKWLEDKLAERAEPDKVHAVSGEGKVKGPSKCSSMPPQAWDKLDS